MSSPQERPQRPSRARWPYLAAVLATGVAVRVWGLRWGLPNEHHLFSYHPDEYHSLRGALALACGDPNPHFFNYGSLYLYLVALACLWHQAVLGGPDLLAALLKAPQAHVEMAAWVLDARLVVVLCGALTVWVAWLAGHRLGGIAGAIAAGAGMAVAPLHVLNSHYATVDVPLTLFVALSLLFSVRHALGDADEPRWRNLLLAGVCAGLAASVKYNGATVLLAPLVAEMLRGKGAAPWPLRLGAILGTGALALAAFALTSPYVLIAWPEAWRDISFELQHMRAGEAPALTQYPNGWLFHLHPALVLTALALILGRGKPRRAALPAVAFGAVWFALIGSAGVRYARYELPLEPVGALALAVALAGALQSRAPLRRQLALAAAACWLAAGLTTDLARDRVLAHTDVRQDMLATVLQQVGPDETLGLMWEPWFSNAPVDYCNGGTALRSNPLFRRFQRPVRRLVVTAVDPQTLRHSRPPWLLVSDFETEGGSQVARLLPVVPGEEPTHRVRPYTVEAVATVPFPSDHPLRRFSASDSRYPCPRLTLMQSTAASPAR
jgi:hypothetical protein